jgi:hypothetical protein
VSGIDIHRLILGTWEWTFEKFRKKVKTEHLCELELTSLKLLQSLFHVVSLQSRPSLPHLCNLEPLACERLPLAFLTGMPPINWAQKKPPSEGGGANAPLWFCECPQRILEGIPHTVQFRTQTHFNGSVTGEWILAVGLSREMGAHW